jgi:hypothetical protein
MRQIRNWYPFLEQSGLIAGDFGPGKADGTLTANVTHCQYYYPLGVPYGYKGLTFAASVSRVVSAAAANFPADAGSIEMLVRPTWNRNDGIGHYFWDTYGGNNRSFRLYKHTDDSTYLYTDLTYRGEFVYSFVAGTLYHIVLNWGTNELYINKVLVKNFSDGGLGNGASTLYIGDRNAYSNVSFSGNIYFFIARDVALTLAEITAFYNFWYNLYIEVAP